MSAVRMPGLIAGTVVQVSLSAGGIPKRAVKTAAISKTGVQGDRFNHPRIHGGANQAILLIASEILDELRSRGYPVFPGALGENVTTRGLDVRQWRIGQVWRVGSARIHFTKVRVPCAAIQVYGEGIGREIYDARVTAGDHSSPVWAWSGMYGRIVDAGLVASGDAVSLDSELA